MLVYVTVPEESAALELARGAVCAGLAAGANIAGPCRSIYRWQGEIREAREWQIFFQTSAFKSLAAFLAKLHPHVTPCIIGLKLDAGHPAFLDWINSSGDDRC